MNLTPALPIGVSSFVELRRSRQGGGHRYRIVDKTMPFISEIMKDGAEVLLFTHFIRSMKTTNLKMLKAFLDTRTRDENRELFDGLAIMDAENVEARTVVDEHYGQYPVIFLSLKDVGGRDWELGYITLRRAIMHAYEEHQYLLESSVLNPTQKTIFQAILNGTVPDVPYYTQIQQEQGDFKALYNLFIDSLRQLSEYLYLHYNKQVIILIDEYDTPLHVAYLNDEKDPGYFEKMADFLKAFLKAALKDNDECLAKGVMTGVLRTAFSNLVSALNNVKVESVLSRSPQYASCFGITEEELAKLLADLNITDPRVLDTLRAWYNGYQLHGITLYNPWSVMNYLQRYQSEGALVDGEAYWLQTGDSSVIGYYFKRYFDRVSEKLLALVRREEIEVSLDDRTAFEDIDRGKEEAFWGLLVHTGYLTVLHTKQQGETRYSSRVRIPNYEVLGAYAIQLQRYFEEKTPKITTLHDRIKDSLVKADIEQFITHLRTYIEQVVSYWDVSEEEGIPARGDRRRSLRQKESRSAKELREKEEQEEEEKQEKPEKEEIETSSEQFYHHCLLWLMSVMHGYHYVVDSNRESGYGRYDLLLFPTDENRPAIILEFKKAKTEEDLPVAAATALRQIEQRRYGVRAQAHGIDRGVHMGIAFFGRQIDCQWIEVKYPRLPDVRFNPYPQFPISREHLFLSSSSSSNSSFSFFEKNTEDSRMKRLKLLRHYRGEYDEETVNFEIHETREDGDCGFYALPIPGDRAGVRDLLLSHADNEHIRCLVAPEIQDAAISGELPNTLPDYAFYQHWKQGFDAVSNIPGDQNALLDQLRSQLNLYTQTETAYRNFITQDTGVRGRLAFYGQSELTSTIDAVAELAKLHICIWQSTEVMTEDDQGEFIQLKLITERGSSDGTLVHLYHQGGTNSHFELMSVLPSAQLEQNVTMSFYS